MVLERPKTTGRRSENNHFMGHCRDIMGQLQIPSTMLHHVAYAILTIDAEGMDDWPMESGKPLEWTLAGGALAALAIERAHHFADYFGLYLTEINGAGIKYRVTY